ncbi:hypothetical protein [Paenibacillus protaetiae]|uniref:HEAT repeat domain-containing protein n=1 Tax=Paenibacillus protaetiae TaxID=2509456 RepID=A0A4P6ES85_9BACL|nr:hypothetical protein [Paenibacillus protaetiae]QAY65960.1 hypothetical protein ET464_05730 [Paenibacillus protaetiae]
MNKMAISFMVLTITLAGTHTAWSAENHVQPPAGAIARFVQPHLPAGPAAFADKQEAAAEAQSVETLIGKLKDRSYTRTYGEGFVWYTAAEDLGLLGKQAVPALIANLGTPDDYERALTLYALLLATQEPDVKAFAEDDYIHGYLDFDPVTQVPKIIEAETWWEKYKSNWA